MWLPFRPKGPTSNVCLLQLVKTQTNTDLECRTIRTAIMLTLASCYLMWMVTYMAQLHPLISKLSNSSLWLYWLAHELQRHIVQRAERVYDGHASIEHCEQEIDVYRCRYDIDRIGGDPPVPDFLDQPITLFYSFRRGLVYNGSTFCAIHLSLLVSGFRSVFSRVIFNTLHGSLEQPLRRSFRHTRERSSRGL
jgi:hypothetical protein